MDTKQLRELAEAAKRNSPYGWFTVEQLTGLHTGKDDHLYIAALSPARVLRMIDAIEKAQEALGLARDYVNAAYVERSQLYASYPHRWATEREDLSKVDAARTALSALKEET